MVKRAHYAIRTSGWWAAALLALLVAWVPGGTRTFGEGQAGKPEAKAAKPAKKTAPKPAPKAARVKATKKAQPSKAPKAAVPKPPATEKVQPAAAGLRDPFKLPEPPRVGPEGRIGNETRPTGPRGLAVGEMTLEGLVREEASKTMIAVVAGPERRAFFLRVNDPVYRATVSRITLDSVYFTETYTDPAGHESTREVVKKLPATGEKP
jgi:hypothetical protein